VFVYEPVAQAEPEVLPRIKGEIPDSKEELLLALALDKYEIPYIFHFRVRGSLAWAMPGDIEIDFLVFNPFGTPLEIYGRKWHGGGIVARDKIRQYIIQQIFGKEMIIVYDDELEDLHEAEQVVLDRIMG